MPARPAPLVRPPAHATTPLAARVLLALLALVASGLVVLSAPSPAHAAAPTVTRDEVIARADYWFRASNGQVAGVSPFGRNVNATAAEPPPGTSRYRTDCSGMVSMAWRLGTNPSSTMFNDPSYGYTVPITVAQLKAGDVLATNGHVTMFHYWVNQAAGQYMAYDFGGGGAGNTGNADGRMEHKTYTLVDHGSYVTRNNDTRQYHAYRGANVVDGLKGTFDSATVSGADVRVAGWAFQQGSPTSTTSVSVTINDTTYSRSTGVARSDVVAAYGLPSTAKPGFDTTIGLPGPGSYRVCVTASASGSSLSLGCKTVTRSATTLVSGLLYQPITPTRKPTVSIAAGQQVTVDLSGTAAHKAASATLTAVGPAADGFLSAWQCGRRPETSTLNYRAGVTRAAQAIVPMDANGQICLYSTAATQVIIDINGWMRADTGYRLNPVAVRKGDTRQGQLGGRLTAGKTLVVQVSGQNGIPAVSSSKAVALNLTVVNPAAAGHLTVWNCAGSKPNASSLNYTAGKVVSNSISSALSATGTVCIYSLSATDLVVDIQGWHGATGRTYRSLAPLRLVDTRSSNPARRAGGSGSPVAAGGTARYDVGGALGIPTAAAVASNATAVATGTAGFVTTWNCAATRPGTSHVNYEATGATANFSQVAANGNGELCSWTSASSHLIVDVFGIWQ